MTAGRFAAGAGRRVHQLGRSVLLLAEGSECASTSGRQALPQGGFNITRRSYFSAATTTEATSRGPVSYVSLALTAATGAGLIYYFNHLKNQKLQHQLQETVSVGSAAVGGPFSLVDHTGKPFTEKDLLGEFAVLYFGFTTCPDICPDELDKLTAAVNSVEKQTGRPVQPVFVSVDPERDSVPQVQSYIKDFHPRLIGLTGSVDQVKQAAKSYRVYYSKTGDDSDYLVDHSIIMYLVNPVGDFVTFYGKNFDAEQLAKSISQHVTAWKASHNEYGKA